MSPIRLCVFNLCTSAVQTEPISSFITLRFAIGWSLISVSMALSNVIIFCVRVHYRSCTRQHNCGWNRYAVSSCVLTLACCHKCVAYTRKACNQTLMNCIKSTLDCIKREITVRSMLMQELCACIRHSSNIVVVSEYKVFSL